MKQEHLYIFLQHNSIYICFYRVTQEHRETLSKNAKEFSTKCCNNIRDIRSKYIKVVKQKEGLPKDLIFRTENSIDSLSNQYISKVEELLQAKQKELLGDSE